METWLITGLGTALGLVLLWGVIAPRSQWRVLHGWSARDPGAAEPGDGLHGVRRAISAVGLLALLAVGIAQLGTSLAQRPAAAAEPTALERMWGTPVPRLVDRVVLTTAEAPAQLVAGEIRGYQEIDRGYPPNYLAELARFSLLGDPAPAGIIGSAPVDGFTGYGAGDIVVEASGPLTCIPRVAVAIETTTLVQLGVHWGLPGGLEQDHAAGCDMTLPIAQDVLIPVQLSEPLDGRLLVTADGVPLSPVDDLLR